MQLSKRVLAEPDANNASFAVGDRARTQITSLNPATARPWTFTGLFRKKPENERGISWVRITSSIPDRPAFSPEVGGRCTVIVPPED